MAKFDEVEECRHSHTDVRSVNWSYLLEGKLVISVKLQMNILCVQAVHSQEVFSIDRLADILPSYVHGVFTAALFVREKQNKIRHSLNVYQLRALLTSYDSCTLEHHLALF